jgi:hypothetical protein
MQKRPSPAVEGGPEERLRRVDGGVGLFDIAALIARRPQARSEPPRGSGGRPPREELTYAEVKTLRRADRRPVLSDFPPRRILAAVPAHSNARCPVTLRLKFASLIGKTTLKCQGG